MNNIRAAVVQMVSGADPQANIDAMQTLVAEAAGQGAEWVLLPEYWPLMGMDERDKLAFAETLGDGPFQTAMSQTAAACGVTLFGGTVPLKSSETGKVMNTMTVYDPQGKLVAHYHKMHLFGFSDGIERYAEADTISAGGQIPDWEIGGIRCAVGVCYDLRFPEFFRAQLPFEVLLLPAAFTYTTGRAHWSLLLRARAVENQCFVLAAAQGGRHNNGRHTYGHSMIVNPWGEVLAQTEEGSGVVCADLDAAVFEDIRKRLPALAHRVLPTEMKTEGGKG